MYAYKDFYEGKAHIPTPRGYKPCRYVSPQRIRFLLCCGLKLGIGFAPFGLELGMVFEESMGVCECICCFNSKLKMGKKD